MRKLQLVRDLLWCLVEYLVLNRQSLKLQNRLKRWVVYLDNKLEEHQKTTG